jgi:two-component system cell cycle response regulator
MARILVIEDNRDNLDLMQYLLVAFGHDTIEAGSGDVGLEMARSVCPDLILCDIHMPGMDGYTLVGKLRQDATLRHTPVVAVTAMAMLGDRERGMQAGFDGYIYKPIDPETFVPQVQAFLRADLHGARPTPAAINSSALPAAVASALANILVVDDSAENRELLVQVLQPFGYAVTTAAGVAEALRSAEYSLPDIVLTDLHMPDRNGFGLIRELKQDDRFARIPIIVITASAWEESHRIEAARLGVARFLLRPIEPRQLIEEVASCLAGDRGGAHGDDPRR